VERHLGSSDHSYEGTHSYRLGVALKIY